MTETRALTIVAKNTLSFETLELPEIGDYEVLFKTKMCSLCTVDRRTFLGTRSYSLPFLGGHECSGIIEKVGRGVVDVSEGNHAIFTSGYCNQCDFCRTGKGTQCINKSKMPQRVKYNGTILGGGLSEYLVIPAWQLIKVSKHIPFEYAALTEPLACCIHSVEKARIKFGESVVIIGFGIMGYFQMRLAQLKGAHVIVVDPSEEKRLLAKQFGACTLNSNDDDLLGKIKDLTGFGADVVINSVPFSTVWTQAMNMLAPYGRLIAYSSQNSSEGIPVDFGKVHSKEYEFIGTLNPTIEDNLRAVKLIESKLIEMSVVIDRIFPFEKGFEAFAEACKPDKFRILISYK